MMLWLARGSNLPAPSLVSSERRTCAVHDSFREKPIAKMSQGLLIYKPVLGNVPLKEDWND
jgi:hypothetical protein